MNDQRICPACGVRVVPSTDGTCPSCRQRFPQAERAHDPGHRPGEPIEATVSTTPQAAPQPRRLTKVLDTGHTPYDSGGNRRYEQSICDGGSGSPSATTVLSDPELKAEAEKGKRSPEMAGSPIVV